MARIRRPGHPVRPGCAPVTPSCFPSALSPPRLVVAAIGWSSDEANLGRTTSDRAGAQAILHDSAPIDPVPCADAGYGMGWTVWTFRGPSLVSCDCDTFQSRWLRDLARVDGDANLKLAWRLAELGLWSTLSDPPILVTRRGRPRESRRPTVHRALARQLPARRVVERLRRLPGSSLASVPTRASQARRRPARRRNRGLQIDRPRHPGVAAHSAFDVLS